MSNIDIPGGRELFAALDKLPDAIALKIMRAGLRASGRVFLENAKQTTAFADRTGMLRKSLRLSIGSRVKNGEITGRVRAGGGKENAFYAHFIEFGTVKMSAKPFMRTTFDSQGARAVTAFVEEARKRWLREKLSQYKGAPVRGMPT